MDQHDVIHLLQDIRRAMQDADTTSKDWLELEKRVSKAINELTATRKEGV